MVKRPKVKAKRQICGSSAAQTHANSRLGKMRLSMIASILQDARREASGGVLDGVDRRHSFASDSDLDAPEASAARLVREPTNLH